MQLLRDLRSCYMFNARKFIGMLTRNCIISDLSCQCHITFYVNRLRIVVEGRSPSKPWSHMFSFRNGRVYYIDFLLRSVGERDIHLWKPSSCDSSVHSLVMILLCSATLHSIGRQPNLLHGRMGCLTWCSFNMNACANSMDVMLAGWRKVDLTLWGYKLRNGW